MCSIPEHVVSVKCFPTLAYPAGVLGVLDPPIWKLKIFKQAWNRKIGVQYAVLIYAVLTWATKTPGLPVINPGYAIIMFSKKLYEWVCTNKTDLYDMRSLLKHCGVQRVIVDYNCNKKENYIN